MKRRVIVAVLFVLVPAASGLLGCGGAARQDTEVIKGKPIQGGGPVTRSVAWIEAHRDAAASFPETQDADGRGAGGKEVPSGQHVREKPEPGEEGGPPKSAARAV